MPMAVDCIINLGSKMHQNLHAEPKYFYIKTKKINSLVSLINLFQLASEEGHPRTEINL